jgi:DNA-binding response OmpR family regulator
VDIHVRRLRKKLGSALPLETLRGVGYTLAACPKSPGSGPVSLAV